MSQPVVQNSLARLSLAALLLAAAGSANALDFDAGNTRVSIYGFAKLDVIYDADNDLGNLVARPRILIDGQQGSSGHTSMHVNQSRLGFKTATPVEGSDLETMLEVDWFDAPPEGGDLRLRHAYGAWNGLLAGKTWTNFGSRLGMTPTIDMAPQPGQSKIGRKVQLRYSWNQLHLALETPEPEDYTDGLAQAFNPARGGYAQHEAQKYSLPDLTLRYQQRAGDVDYSAAAMVRQLEVDAPGLDDRATGWGLNLAGRLPVSDALTLRGAVTWGDGIGEYLQNNPTAAGFISNGKITTLESWGANVGASLKVGPGAINLGYGISRADVDALEDSGVKGANGANKQFEATHLNYIWSPAKRISLGLETGYHTRKVADGRSGDALRFQGMVKYAF